MRDHEGDRWATRLQLPAYEHADVIVDPSVAVDMPPLVHGGASVEGLAGRFQAGDSVAVSPLMSGYREKRPRT